MHSSALISTIVTHSSCIFQSLASLSFNQSWMLLPDLLHTFLGLPIFPSIWLKSYTGSPLPLILNLGSSSFSPNLNLAVPPAISLTLCANQCLQRPLYATDSLDLLVPSVRTALVQCRAFAVTGPSSWNGLPSDYKLSLCPVFPLHLVVLLTRFFSSRSFRAESASYQPILREAHYKWFIR